MSGDTEVIRQFLVSLGFQVDQTGLKKFVSGLGAANNAALLTGKAVLGVAVAAEAMVVQFASSMEKLYYQSKRTGSSVENLQALEFGSRKIGLAAGVAREALEAMTSAVRMNPGLRGLVDSLLGKKTSGLDQAQVMIELVQKLSSLPHFQGARFAQLFGMDEKTFFMLKEGLPELIKAEQERRDLNKQAGIDAQKAAEAGKEYANSIKDITERVSVLRDKLAVELLPSFRDFNGQVVTALNNLAKFKADDHPVMKGVGGTVVGAGKSLGQLSTGIAQGDWSQIWSGLKGVMYNAPGTALIRKGYGKIEDGFDWVNKWRNSYRPGGANADTANPHGLPLGMRQNNPGNLRSWPGAPTQNGFASFSSSQYGLQAMAANLLSYYNKRGLNNVRDIVARWAPASDGNNTSAYVESVSKRLGVGATDALNLKDPAVLSRLMGAMIQQEQGYKPFGSAELLAAAQSRLGGAGKQVVLNQKTDIHVAGGDSPTSTGRAVAAAQDQVNNGLVRNFQGAVQ